MKEGKMSTNKNVESRYLIMSFLKIDFTMKKKKAILV